MSILHLAGKASIRQRPVNSALDTANTHERDAPRFGQAVVSYGLSLIPEAGLGQSLCSRSRDPAASWPQTSRSTRLSIVALAWRHLSAQALRCRSCSALPLGTQVQHRTFIPCCPALPASALSAGRLVVQTQVCRCHALQCRGIPFRSLAENAVSNLTLNRSTNGTAPWPRGAVFTSSASRPGRCAVVARLAQR